MKLSRRMLVLDSAAMFAGALGTTLLSACSNGVQQDNSTQGSATDGAFSVTINHAFGSTTITSRPSRVVTLAWNNHEPILALGITPVGISAANFGVAHGEKMLPWTKEAFQKLGVDAPTVFDDTDGIDFEAVSDTAPDVILCPYSGYTQADYDKLSQIAPTVAYPQKAWSCLWREQTRIEARALGKEEEAERLIADLEDLIRQKASQSRIAGQAAAFLNIPPTDMGTVYVYLPSDPRGAYLADLGFKTPESVTALASSEDSFAATLSAEQADRLNDVDIAVTYGDEAFLAQLQADPLLGRLPCIQHGAVALLKGDEPLAASCTPGPLSIPATIDQYLDVLSSALERA